MMSILTQYLLQKGWITNMKIRLMLGIIVCKLLLFIGKISGKKASSAPGMYATKICPDLLSLLARQVKEKKICVLGTNGKTTTNNMINMLLENSGYKTVCNKIGANMIDGATTAFADKADIFGRLDCDYSVIEVDEAYAKILFKFFSPDIIVITNLFRDQLDRYGEIDMTVDHIKKAIESAPNAALVLNMDDPISNHFSKICANKVVSYGVFEKVLSDTEETQEGKYCRLCGSELRYNYYHYSQLGDYECKSCGYKREKPDFFATNVNNMGKVSFTLNEKTKINSNTYGFYNIYNMLAAISVLEASDVKIDDYTKAFSFYKPQVARMEEFDFKKPIILNLAKNPAGFNQAISAVVNDNRKKAVVIAVNDAPSDGRDITWIYDVDFEKLKDFSAYAVSGKRRYDLALRLYYGDICENPEIGEDTASLAIKLLDSDCEVVYALVNYTVMFDTQIKLLSELKKYKETKSE